MKKTARLPPPSKTSTHTKRLRESASIFIMAIAVFVLAALLSFHATDPGWSHISNTAQIQNLTGRTGAFLSDVLFSLVGYIAYFVPAALAYASWRVYHEANQGAPQSQDMWDLRALGFLMSLSSGAGLTALHYHTKTLPMSAGGVLGSIIQEITVRYFEVLGANILLGSILLAGLTLFMGISWPQVFARVARLTYKALLVMMAGASEWLRETWQQTLPNLYKKIQDFLKSRSPMEAEPSRAVAIIDLKTTEKPPIIKPAPVVTKPVIVTPPIKVKTPTPAAAVVEPVFKPTKADSAEAPSLSLLEMPDGQTQLGYSEQALQDLSVLVERRLQEFGVNAKVVAVSPGPVITRFELDPAAGVKASKIVGLAKDLARALSVVSVRVVEVIPGKSTVGLEIPNQEREIVRLREILADPAYQDAKSHLTLGLGKDISGNVVVADLAKMPHLLVAGTTGSGKSVGLNAMLLSILYKATPQDVRLILIDPKMLELAVYDSIPHLLTPVVTDMKEAANSLRWCVAEMERRYQLMAALGVRNLAGYNKKIQDAIKDEKPILDPLWTPKAGGTEASALSPLPYIVVLIDEFADMMMVVGKKVEELIARIAQKARAAGIHLLLATQRPSVDVITGLIKANIPTRIAFQVSSRIDSRTILDQSGAEQLLGHGDMLYLPPGVGIPIRVHGAFVADEEVHKVVQELRARGKPEYVEAITKTSSLPSLGEGGEDGEDGESDEFYDQAVAIVLESRKVSISYIQRRLKIGYNRAARLIEQMETSGVVSPVQPNGGREILVPEGGA